MDYSICTGPELVKYFISKLPIQWNGQSFTYFSKIIVVFYLKEYAEKAAIGAA